MRDKTLVILRHGKAQLRDPALEDYRRTLKERGARQAEHLSEILAAAGQSFGLILSSSAPRAQETAAIIARRLGLESVLREDKRLYGCDPEDWIHELRKQWDTLESAMVVGHNPELEMLAEKASRERIELPTCGTVRLSGLESWRRLGADKMRVDLVLNPSDTMKDDLDEAQLAALWNR